MTFREKLAAKMNTVATAVWGASFISNLMGKNWLLVFISTAMIIYHTYRAKEIY